MLHYFLCTSWKYQRRAHSQQDEQSKPIASSSANLFSRQLRGAWHNDFQCRDRRLSVPLKFIHAYLALQAPTCECWLRGVGYSAKSSSAASMVRPGPNASMMHRLPGHSRRILSSTNNTVGEDMLP